MNRTLTGEKGGKQQSAGPQRVFQKCESAIWGGGNFNFGGGVSQPQGATAQLYHVMALYHHCCIQ